MKIDNPEYQEKTGRLKDGTFPPGVSGNPNGRPKRKTLTELIHAKLDDTPGAWDKIVKTVITKLSTEKEIIKIFWQYTDGMPVQKNVLAGDEDNPIKLDVGSILTKVYGSTATTSTGKMPDDS